MRRRDSLRFSLARWQLGPLRRGHSRLPSRSSGSFAATRQRNLPRTGWRRSGRALARVHGRHNIQAARFAQPNEKLYMVRRVLGVADLRVTELVLTYDGSLSYVVSIMKFRDGQVASETQYLGDPFEPEASCVLGSSGYAEMFAVKSGPPGTWLQRSRLPCSRGEPHGFAILAPQYTNSATGVNVRFRRWAQPIGSLVTSSRLKGDTPLSVIPGRQFESPGST